MNLSETERALCEKNRIEREVAQQLKASTQQALTQLRDPYKQDVAGVSAPSTENEACDVVETLQEQLPAGYRAFYTTAVLSSKTSVALVRSDDPLIAVRLMQTDAGNYEMDNDAVIERLRQWQTRCDYSVVGAGHDFVAVKFETLPPDLDAFAEEIYEFCPDTIDQHFGCFGEMFEAMEESGEEVPDEVRELMEGVDWSDEGEAGLELLKRSLQRNQRLMLWWD